MACARPSRSSVAPAVPCFALQISSRGSPGFLEPDPIGSVSTANLDLSLSIGPLIQRMRFIDCRLKTAT